MTTATVNNGVDLEQLGATIGLIKDDPQLAQFQFRTRSRWEGGARCVTEITSFYGAGSEQQHARTHVMVGDEPEVLLGADSSPNAVESVLGALAGCLAVGYAYNAAARGIDIEELTFDLHGDLDLHAFLGLSDEQRPGFKNIRATYRVKSSATDDELAELEAHVLRTSPVLDIVRNPVPVQINRSD
ncbi:MAG: OsmC family protein [Thermomicrobiales bacterium]